MKNSLQLELQLKIKRANRFLIAKQYSEAIKEYTQGLELYQENRRYNQSVSEQFQSLLYSLRGHTYSLNINVELAEEDFAKSLSINPYSAVTLSRRAKHLMKQKRFSEAVQDIDLALLYDPQNLSYMSLLNSIQNYINECKDQQQKKHISTLISEVKSRLTAKPATESQSEEQDSQQLLNFSKLKKIDRKSISASPKGDKRKSFIEFKEDQILEYVTQKQDDTKEEQKINIRLSSSNEIQEKLKEQDAELEQLQNQEQQLKKSHLNIEQHLILTKSLNKSRKSILRRTSINANKADNMIFISTPGEKSSFCRRSSISAASIRDIDGKVVKHQAQNIKFRPSVSQLSKTDIGRIDQFHDEAQKQNLTRTTPKLQHRKSCLRNSKKFSYDDLEELSKTAPIKRKSSNFLNIKNIDGSFHQKPKEGSEEDHVNVKIQTESDDENQYNIFGNKIEKKQVLQVCQNMQQIPEAIEQKLKKKKSILKRDSFLDGSMLSWKNQKKKSVLFKTG